MSSSKAASHGREPKVLFFTPVAIGVTTGTDAPINSDKPNPELVPWLSSATQILPDPSRARKTGLRSTPAL